ncbi:MAG: hypothetical protein O3A87_10425 [Verrucomicrobia bacterium]|nr:hypothetical protein [Verrucomicrobiota bacterium]MDA1006874.1 hypothetical protein [Verrucomicrobiota bacterium]
MLDHPIVRIGLLLKKVETIETRKKFQKIVHILQVMGAPFPESYDYHHYGAYSAELRRELDAFKSEELIVEPEVNGQFPSFTVKPTAKLLQLLEKLPNPEEAEWLTWASELNGKSPRELEGISTLLYFHQRLWPQASWRDKFATLKPQLAAQYERYETESLRLLETATKAAA